MTPSCRYLSQAIQILSGAIMASSVVFAEARAHDALPTASKPDGWSYPFSCCAGFDCRQVPSDSVAETPQGYVIKRTGEVIPYTDSRVRSSPDGETHWCSVAGAEDGRTICLFRGSQGS